MEISEKVAEFNKTFYDNATKSYADFNELCSIFTKLGQTCTNQTNNMLSELMENIVEQTKGMSNAKSLQDLVKAQTKLATDNTSILLSTSQQIMGETFETFSRAGKLIEKSATNNFSKFKDSKDKK